MFIYMVWIGVPLCLVWLFLLTAMVFGDSRYTREKFKAMNKRIINVDKVAGTAETRVLELINFFGLRVVKKVNDTEVKYANAGEKVPVHTELEGQFPLKQAINGRQRGTRTEHLVQGLNDSLTSQTISNNAVYNALHQLADRLGYNIQYERSDHHPGGFHYKLVKRPATKTRRKKS